MKLYFATEARFIKRDDKYYSLGGFSYTLWERYLEHFDEMIVIARVSTDETIDIHDSMLASHERVRFIDLPYYVGFRGYILNRSKIHHILTKQVKNDGCYICRLPGQIGGALISILKSKGIQYACEVVGNPWDVFAKGCVNHPLRPIIRLLSTFSLKSQVKNSQACLYVTQKMLQKLYPVRKGAFSIGVSDVLVHDSAFAPSPKVLTAKSTYSLISIGSLEQMYKAPDIVLKSLSILKSKGYDLRLTWLGDGKFKKDMIALSVEMNLNINFKGSVCYEEVHRELEKSDIFILVSRTEGLPRAIIEAMAHGLPCIGTRVGGIPELLDESTLIDREDPIQLADLLEKMINNKDFTNLQAKRNLKEALEYNEAILNRKRTSFYNYILENH